MKNEAKHNKPDSWYIDTDGDDQDNFSTDMREGMRSVAGILVSTDKYPVIKCRRKYCSKTTKVRNRRGERKKKTVINGPRGGVEGRMKYRSRIRRSETMYQRKADTEKKEN